MTIKLNFYQKLLKIFLLFFALSCGQEAAICGLQVAIFLPFTVKAPLPCSTLSLKVWFKPPFPWIRNPQSLVAIFLIWFVFCSIVAWFFLRQKHWFVSEREEEERIKREKEEKEKREHEEHLRMLKEQEQKRKEKEAEIERKLERERQERQKQMEK